VDGMSESEPLHDAREQAIDLIVGAMRAKGVADREGFYEVLGGLIPEDEEESASTELMTISWADIESRLEDPRRTRDDSPAA
jgi:hypothetical protein